MSAQQLNYANTTGTEGPEVLIYTYDSTTIVVSKNKETAAAAANMAQGRSGAPAYLCTIEPLFLEENIPPAAGDYTDCESLSDLALQLFRIMVAIKKEDEELDDLLKDKEYIEDLIASMDGTVVHSND